MLSRAGCRTRQNRLLAALERNQCELFVTSDYRTVYYLTGQLSPPDVPVLFALWQDGRSVLVSSVQGEALAGEILKLETYSIARAITHPAHDAAGLLKPALQRRHGAGCCATERAAVSGLIEDTIREAHPGIRFFDASAVILSLRKRKEEDEIDEIRQSLHYCGTAYSAAKATIAAGLTEIDVYNAMYTAVVKEAGAAVPFAGDFACGERAIKEGGPPTRRQIQPHDLYILDLFPAPALYFGDTCRTFAVGEPTELQHRAWEIVREAVRIGESAIRPGVRASSVYGRIKEFLDSHELTEKSFWHHAGHGIGHRGHEAPRIIPGSEDIFETGDVITLEPGVYTQALQGGIRLEDNYVVREDGLENLFDFPMDL